MSGAHQHSPGRFPCRGVVVKWMDRLLYVDGFVDVARAYVLYGDFWISLPVALSAPLQLLALVMEGIGTVEHSQLGLMQVCRQGWA